VLATLEHRQFFRVFVLSIGKAGHEARQRTGSRSGVPFLGQGVGWLVGIGCRRVLVLALLYRRQFAGPSSSRSLKAAAGQRRRQLREHLEGDRGPVG
jgi:hypothetical protein